MRYSSPRGMPATTIREGISGELEARAAGSSKNAAHRGLTWSHRLR